MKNRTPILATAIALFLPTLASAQSTLFTYAFADVTTTSGLNSAGGVASGITFGSFSAVGTPTNPNAAGRFSFTDWSLGATNGSDIFTGGINTAEYYQVTLTPGAGVTLDLDSITFTLQRSGTGIRQYSVRSSLDSFASNLSASIDPANAALSVVGTPQANIFQVTDASTVANTGSKLTLGLPFDALAGAVTFRFYGYNAEAAGGTFSIDNVAFIGTSIIAARNLTWNPPGGNWNTTDTNWLDGAASVAYANGDNVNFTDAGLAAGSAATVDAGGLAPNNINVSNTTGTYTITGGALAGTGLLTKSNNGTLVLGSTYSNAVNVTGGTLRTAASERLSDTAATSVGAAAVLDLDVNTETVGGLVLTGGTVNGSGSLVLGGDVTSNASAAANIINAPTSLSANRTVTTATNSVIRFNGALSGAGRLALTGSGLVELNADNTAAYTGNVQLNTGVTLSLGHQGALGSGQFFFNAGTLQAAGAFTGANAIANAVSLGGSPTIGGSQPVEFNGAWTFFTTAAKTLTTQVPVTINGPIGGGATGTGAALTLAGTGSAKLNGTNSFTSLTLSSDFVAELNGANTLTNGATVNLNASLRGVGSVIGPVVADGGRIEPGNVGDSTSVFGTGNLSLLNGAEFRAELVANAAGAFDQLLVTGTVSISAPSTLTVIPTGAPFAFGTAFTIVDNDGADSVSGIFDGLAEGTNFTVGSQEFDITYVGGDGNDIVLTAVPEPGSVALLLGGLAMLGARRRRKQP